MDDELKALRAEVAELRKEVEALRLIVSPPYVIPYVGPVVVPHDPLPAIQPWVQPIPVTCDPLPWPAPRTGDAIPAHGGIAISTDLVAQPRN